MNNWYLNRLSAMSVFEIFYRVRQFVKGYLEEKSWHKIEFTSPEYVSGCNILDIQVSDVGIIPDTLNLFGTDFSFSKPSEINWQRDIISGEVFPPAFYRKIKIRENPKLSAKCVWEVNRLQFLTGICMNYKVTKSNSFLDLFMQLNESWSIQNPFLTGINWYSNIEINLRLITWFLCWEILDADNLLSEDKNFNVFLNNVWMPMIKSHCVYSFKNPSIYSSANNHLISEYAGLFIAASKWKFKESDNWVRYAQNGLEKEIKQQHSSGINREEAAEYIQFITDFFLLSFVVGEKTDRPFSGQYKQQLFQIFCYIRDFLDLNGNFPRYGDEDDGKCFILDFDKKFNNFKSLLTSGAIIFNDPLLKAKSNGFDNKNHILFGDQGKMIYESIPDIKNNGNSVFYKDAGHFIFRKKENDQELFLHFDAAPLGYLSIAAHGHADALSFILNVDGYPVFIDSGTYTYHTEPEWRRYFIGTLSHNTIRINQKDQAVSGGPTLWVKHYRLTIIDHYLSREIDRIKATHDGYLKEGALHIREIVFDKISNEFQILDTIVVRGDRKLQIEIPFHIHPEVEITREGNSFHLISENQIRKTEFYIDDKLDPVLINGQIKPQILGWYSDSFLKKKATNVIYCKTQIDCTTTFKFNVRII